MGLEFAINVNTGRKVLLAKNAALEAMAMLHRSKKDADPANAMDMAMKQWAFATFKPVNAFANTIPRE